MLSIADLIELLENCEIGAPSASETVVSFGEGLDKVETADDIQLKDVSDIWHEVQLTYKES